LTPPGEGPRRPPVGLGARALTGIGPGARPVAGTGLGARGAGGSAVDPREAWRLFIAVPVPPDVREALADAIAPVRRDVDARWQSQDTWHLTLRFLGDTPAEAVPRIGAALEGVAAACRPFRAELGGSGTFGRGRDGAVAWIGVGAGSAELTALATAIARALDPAAAAREAPFRAHLTLARQAPPDVEAGLGEALADAGRLAWTADRVILYRSILGRGPAQHIELVTALLGAGPG
jgi:RNA 2',3'-cyclic 3'-phosphodiesterase